MSERSERHDPPAGPMDPSAALHEAAQEVAVATGSTLSAVLNGIIAKLVGWPFTVTSGFIGDGETRTEGFACVVHTTPAVHEGLDASGLPADGVAAVIDASDYLDLEHLRAAYARISQAKRLKRRPAPALKGTPTTTVILGIILARKSDLPLETLGQELDRLNAETPGRQRPDMLVVAGTGVVNYAVQFPGEGVTGDFLPPGEGALDAYTPPIYVVMVMCPSADRSLNKMMAFLCAHLEIFSPGANVPKRIDLLKGVTQNVVTLMGYQYNLAGELVPVPREFYNDRYMAPLPVLIEDGKGKVLSTLRFLPWQDGAAILLKGKLPLEGLLVFLGKDALKRSGVIRLKESQISYVLPITGAGFKRMLQRLQQQSNMIVRPVEPTWTVQKFADEGSSSPFLARLMIGLLSLRDQVFPDSAARNAFDQPYDFVLKSLFSARDAMRELTLRWNEHRGKVESGQVARLQGRSIHVDEDVSKELSQKADAFLNASTRALKKGMQDVANVVGVSLGFFFQKQAGFEAGLAALSSSDPTLAAYLRHARTWSERLINARNAVEHDGWTLPRVTYTQAGDKVIATEPTIMGQPATEFTAFVFDRAACFVEEVTAHCLRLRLPPLLALAEVPHAERPDEKPERFRLTLAIGGTRPWALVYHVSSFDET